MHKDKAGRMAGLWITMPVLLILWGSFAAVSKLTLSGIDSFQLQFWMFGTAAAGMTLSLLLRRKLARTLRLRRGQIVPVLLCGFTHYLYYLLYTLSLRMIPAAEASMLNYLFPVMVVLFAIPINGDRLTPLNAVSVALGFAGTLVVLTGGRFTEFNLSNLGGDLLALGGAAAWGLYSNLGRRIDGDTESGIWYTIVISLALSTLSLFLFSTFKLPDPLSLAGAAWLGVSNIWLSLPLWMKILKTASTALAAGIAFVTPFLSLLFILLLAGEPISLGQVAGLLVISTSILLQGIRRKRPAAAKQDLPPAQ